MSLGKISGLAHVRMGTAAAFAAVLWTMPAHAQSYIDPATGIEYLDPANFHVGADSSGGPGSDPNPIVSNSKFFVADVPNNGIDNPLTLYFVVPNGQGAPIITAIKYGGVTPELFSPVVDTGFDFTSGDIYTKVGCVACDNSLNFSNVSTAEKVLFGGVAPTTYDIFKSVVQVGFSGKDFIEVDGTFDLGTIIAPLAFNNVYNKDGVLKSVKLYDTSWTNTGLITSGVPEPSTWAMMLLGFAGLGYAGFKRTRKSPRFAL